MCIGSLLVTILLSIYAIKKKSGPRIRTSLNLNHVGLIESSSKALSTIGTNSLTLPYVAWHHVPIIHCDINIHP